MGTPSRPAASTAGSSCGEPHRLMTITPNSALHRLVFRKKVSRAVTTEETIFAEALAKGSGSERAAFLDEACSANVQLRRAVESLLLAHERAGGILEGS